MGAQRLLMAPTLPLNDEEPAYIVTCLCEHDHIVFAFKLNAETTRR